MARTRKLPRWVQEHTPEELVDSTVFRFNVTLPNGHTVSLDTLPDLDIDYDQLEHQLTDLPSQYYYWSALMIELKTAVEFYDRRVKVRRGVVTEQATVVQKETGVRLTVDQVKAIVEEDEQLNQLEEKRIALQRQAGKLNHMTVALQMKSEHLRSLCASKRQEREQSGRNQPTK